MSRKNGFNCFQGGRYSNCKDENCLPLVARGFFVLFLYFLFHVSWKNASAIAGIKHVISKLASAAQGKTVHFAVFKHTKNKKVADVYKGNFLQDHKTTGIF